VSQPVQPASTVQRDPAFVDAYANQLRVAANVSDLSIVFGLEQDLGPGVIVSVDKAAIHLSYVTAKALAEHLNYTIEAYEQAVSPIHLSKALPEHLESLKSQMIAAFQERVGNK